MSGNGQRPPRKNPAGRSCQTAIAALVAVACVFTFAGWAAASPHAAKTGCFQAYDYAYQNGGGIEDWAQMDWETTTCNYQARVAATFQAGSSTTTVDSGWVEALELDTRASGPNTLWGLTKAIIQVEPDGGGSWRTCREIYPVYGNEYNC